jgi:threonine/homoserine/homoserine lactone efflux protein
MAMGPIIEALLLGLVAGAVPGPILTGTFTEILNTNFVRSLRVIFYAVLAETIGAILILYVLVGLGLSTLVIQIISVVGAIVLFWLASKVWTISQINTEGKKVLSFYQIVILTVLNSGYWVFWITVGVPKAIILDITLIYGKLIYLITFEIGWLLATLALAFIFSRFRPLLQRHNLVSLTFKILASVLVILGIKTLLSAFGII